MSLQVCAGTAFRWKLTTLSAKATDFVRVRRDGGVHLALLANGHEGEFSTCWPPASRNFLDLFEAGWLQSKLALPERLAEAFAYARERFEGTATLLAVAVEGLSAHAAWVGGDVAVLARGFRVVAQTVPQPLHDRIARAIEAATFEAAAGDTIVLVSKASFGGPCVPVDTAAYAAALDASPAAVAARLAEVGFARQRVPYTAVAALRFDDVEDGAPPWFTSPL